MATTTTTSGVYINVIEDVVNEVREEFINNGGPWESVLTELQGIWEVKMMQAGVLSGPIERSSAQKATTGGPLTHDLNVPYEGTEEYETPTAEMLFPPAMEVAKEAGALLSYDPNLREPLWPSAEEARTQIMSIWDKAEIIKVSDVELEFLTGNKTIDDETAMSLWHPNLKLLLVTLGEHGCRYYAKNFHGSVETFNVDAVDTTGAGDSLVGALLSQIVDDQSVIEEEERLRKVLRFANACGTITKGAIPALPTDCEAQSFLKDK